MLDDVSGMRTAKLISNERNEDVVLALPVIGWASVRLELHSAAEVPQFLDATAE